MNPPDPLARPRRVGAVAAALAAVIVVVVAGWWLQRAARADALDTALASYAPTLSADAPVDPALADLGAEVFDLSCASCHAVHGDPGIGPALAGVTRRRSAEWITAMVLRPDSMTEYDAEARALKEAYGGVQMMVPGGADPRRARAVLEFLRRVDAGG